MTDDVNQEVSPDNEHFELGKYKAELVDEGWAEKILENAVIKGDDFNGKYLTPALLKEEGLVPRYKLPLDDTTICYLSPGYELGNGRLAVVSYVEKDGVVSARSYYRSNSQGIWRLLPDYTIKNGKLGWFGKGRDEESLTLPAVMQKTLSEIVRNGEQIKKTKNDPELIFTGTAKKYGGSESDYYKETDSDPKLLDGDFYSEKGKTSPEQIQLTVEQMPDFSKLLASWEQDSSLYGKFLVKVYPSMDKKLGFMICNDSRGRVWVGGIENNSKFQSTGLRKEWVRGGHLATPAYEYKTDNFDHTGGYGDENNRNGAYVDMYKNYISRIPLIQRYQSTVQKSDVDNEPELTSRAEGGKAIRGAQSFTELYQALDQLGGLRGSLKYHQSSELKSIIERVRRGELQMNTITSTEGLRDRVEYLLNRLRGKI